MESQETAPDVPRAPPSFAPPAQQHTLPPHASWHAPPSGWQLQAPPVGMAPPFAYGLPPAAPFFAAGWPQPYYGAPLYPPSGPYGLVPAPPPPPPPGASDWLSAVDEDGETYYHNTKTGQVSWDKPAGFVEKGGAGAAGPVPVRSTAVEGCPDWAEVHTDDGRRYFFRESSGELSWSEPPAVVGARAAAALRLREAAAEAQRAAAQRAEDAQRAREAAQRAAEAALKAPAELEDDTFDATFTEEDILKPAEAARAAEEAALAAQREKRRAETAAATAAAEAFTALLRDKGVTQHTSWAAALPRLALDARYSAVSAMSARRSLFDAFVKELKACGARASASASKPSTAATGSTTGAPAFRALLEECAMRGPRGDFPPDASLRHVQAFAEEHADVRWTAVGADQRAAIFAERIAPTLRDAAVAAAVTAGVPSHSAAAAVAGFCALMAATRGVRAQEEWSRAKERVERRDPRYEALPRGAREAAFQAWAASVAASAGIEKAADAAAAAAPPPPGAAREAAVRKRKAQEAEHLSRERARARLGEARGEYATLLAEAVRECDARWEEWGGRLERDALGRGDPPELSRADREGMFREHVAALVTRGCADFVTMLSERIRMPREEAAAAALQGGGPLCDWHAAQQLLRPDARFGRCPAAERETLWRAHAADLLARLKADATPPPPPTMLSMPADAGAGAAPTDGAAVADLVSEALRGLAEE